LLDCEFDLEITGFSLAEIDLVLDAAQESATSSPAEADDDIPPSLTRPRQPRVADLWQLGRTRLIWGDARMGTVMSALIEGQRSDLIFTDPPYNVPIDGHVLGRVRHREFAMGSGEVSSQAFTAFLQEALSNTANAARDGCIAFVCMDWRHIGEPAAGKRSVYQLCRAVEGQLAFHPHSQLAAAFLELPGIELPCVGRRRLMHLCPISFLRPSRLGTRLEIGRCADHRHAHVGSNTHRDHVLGDLLVASHARVVLLCDNIGEAVIHDHVDLDVRILL
jgi:hypothetical protein